MDKRLFNCRKRVRKPKRPPYIPTPCPEPGCSYVPDNWDREERHRLMHSGEKPFICTQDPENCHFRANQKAILSVHIRSVHKKIRPFMCHVCPKTCAGKSDLRSHVWTHIDRKKHEIAGCSECDSLILTKQVRHRTESVEQAEQIRKARQARKNLRKQLRALQINPLAVQKTGQSYSVSGEYVEDGADGDVDYMAGGDAAVYGYFYEKMTVEQALAERAAYRQKQIERKRLRRLKQTGSSSATPVRSNSLKKEDTSSEWKASDSEDDDQSFVSESEDVTEDSSSAESADELSDSEDEDSNSGSGAAASGQVQALTPEEEDELLEKLIRFCFIKHPDLVLEVLKEDDS